MSRRSIVAGMLSLVCATSAFAQVSEKSAAMVSTSAYLDALRKNTTTAGKVALAEAGGPTEIARQATIVEIISASQSKVLRQGTNGWTCVADPNGPACADETGMSFFGAWMSKLTPSITKPGVIYMLLGDDGASLTDPFATGKPADAVKSGPHVMLIYPDLAQYAGLPDKPGTGPYVMWKGTPYAHVMVPLK